MGVDLRARGPPQPDFHHSCGLIHDLLPLYRRTKMDCVHGYTIPPIGDVTVGQGRPMLARISHQPSAAASYLLASAVSSSVGRARRTERCACAALRRISCTRKHLRRLATKPGEKSGLGEGIIIFAGLSQLFGNMDDRAAVAGNIGETFRGNAGSGALILGLAGDPETTMADTQFVLDCCRPHQGHC